MRTVTLIFFSGLLFLLAGCGSVSSNMRPTPTPMPSPSPNPSPSPGPAAGPDSLLATWFFTVGKSVSPEGVITLDSAANNGSGNVNANLAASNFNFMLQFCPYPQGFSNCINVASITTGATSSVNTNFTFPVKGTFSGGFQMFDSSGTQSESTGIGITGIGFKSALLPAATITGGIGQTTGNSPGFGSAVVTNGTVHITLTGAFPNHTFNTALCGLFLATPCITLSNITTDAQGNASADVGTLQNVGTTVFRVSDVNGVQFVTAFRVQ